MSGEEAQGGLEGDRLKEMESRMMDRITSLLESAQKKKEKFEEEKAPKVTGKGIQKSLDFNTNLKNLLRKAVHDGEFMEPVKEVLALLSNRNAELVLLDHDPGILAAKEKIDALKALTSESTEAMEESGITKAREKEEPMSSACGAIVSDTMQIGARKNGEFETEFPNRLTRALSFWKEHAREDWVLSVVESGVVVQLESGAKIPEPEGLRPSMLKYKDFLSSEIEKLAMQGVVEQVQDEPRCVSALHVVDQDPC
uniref:Uncharacterized protein n=1 Tax=Caenorhabditis japonica TaxID=281687 RepID=A0A8R1E3W1_CAEJA